MADILMEGGVIKKLIGIIIGAIIVMLAIPFTLTGCNNQPVTADDFELTITVERTEFIAGDRIHTDIIFRNLSGRRLRIAHWGFFDVHIPGIAVSAPPASLASFRTIRRGGEIRRSESVFINGFFVEPGEYEMSFKFFFALNLNNDRQDFTIQSNIIRITVLDLEEKEEASFFDSSKSSSKDIVRGGHHIDDIRRLLDLDTGYRQVRMHTLYEGVISYEFEVDTSSRNETMGQNFDPRRYRVNRIFRGTNQSTNRIVVVLMGDGFTATQQGSCALFPEQGTFLYHARSAMNFMIGFYPFNLFRDLFTFYAVETISNQSGVSIRYGFLGIGRREVDNRFDSHFASSSEFRFNYRYYAPEIRAIAGVAAGGLQNVNMIQVIANSTRFGGSGYAWPNLQYRGLGIALTTVYPPRWQRILVHEFGHTFGFLSDEHTSGLTTNGWGEVANKTREQNNDRVRWNHWRGHGDVGHGAIGVYRSGHAPSGHAIPMRLDRCLMSRLGSTNRPFCAVCAAELTRRLAEVAREPFHGKHPNGYMPGGQNIIIAAGTTRILPYAFNGNAAVRSITIPSSVTTIGRYAFLGTTNLRTIRFPTTTTPLINIGSAFTGVSVENINVVVPRGSLQRFRSNVFWSRFNVIEEGTVATPWNQPRWTSNTLAGHGTVSASGIYRNEAPWRAFNGTLNGGSGGNGDNWSVNSRTGWLELRLDYFIRIDIIEIWDNTSGSNNRSRAAHFTGINGVALGDSFEFGNYNLAYRAVFVRGMRTNIIRLNITSSYGNWVGASMIRIHAMVYH
ncbi:MAG: M64 family metallo-endopeptidase [Firmicutes bacterium]|nr:M64 family metallo-endopeptidase [Bacillota bacterium]